MKQVILVLFALLAGRFGQAQQVNYNWRIGVSGGFTNYYGDLSPYPVDGIGEFSNALKLFTYNKNYTKDYSGQLSLERRLTPTTGLKVHYGQYHFGMSDRYMTPSGKLPGDTPHFDRALNFRTSMEDLGISLVFRADNGKFLAEKSIIAPYLTLGGGWMWYDIKGDLLDADGSPYDYSTSPVKLDETYETVLSSIETEANGSYNTQGLYAALGIGFRIRLGNKLELFAQSTFNHTFTDYLDDVSGLYKQDYPSEFEAYAAKPGTNTVNTEAPHRGNKNNDKDWFIYHGAGIKFSFGSAKSHFKAPQVTSSYNTSPPVIMAKASPEQILNKTDSLTQPLKNERIPNQNGPSVVNNYYFLNWGTPPYWSQLKRQVATLSLDLEIMDQQQLLDSVLYEKSIVDKKLKDFKRDTTQIKSDSTMTEMDKLKALKELEYFQNLEQVKKDSLENQSTAIQNKINDLEQQKERIGMSAANDSLAYHNYLSPIAFQSMDIPGSRNPYSIAQPDSMRLNTASSFDQSSNQEAIVPMASARVAEIEQIAESDKNAEAIVPKAAPEAQYIYLQPGEATQTDITVQAPAAAYQKQKRSWIPIPIFFGGNKNKDKKKNNKDTADTSENLTASTTPWYENISEEDYQKYYLPAAALGMTTAGIFIAADSQEAPNASNTAKPEEIPHNTSAITAAVPQEATSRVDTVYIKGKDTTTLLSSRTEVYFDLNQKTVGDDEKRKLENLANYLKQHPESKINLEGYADNTGNITYNLQLIKERTQAVKDVMIKDFDIAPERVKTLDGGQILRNPTKKEPNQSDRRVEVSLIFE
ncbi:OmpA family protein [Echinicola soli]|uniref:OmpA family protein n=1 Tax=Echinicola soli TaxID=2591634 RepID=A0A514CNH7_9BACT|nr:OmpA family protein [Echinicola soli]QDH81372.1 OmpA family protein [Echinicola soli]